MLRDPVIVNQGGPSASADWVKLDGPSGARSLHVLPGSSADGREEVLYLIADPGLAGAQGSGRPKLGLTLIVERAPALDDPGLLALLTGGVLSLDLTVAPTGSEIQRAAAQTGKDVRPLFIRKARWSLSNEASGEPIAEVELAGNGGSAAISQTVTKEVALAVLAALRGDRSDLNICCEAEFRAAASETVTLHKAATAASATTFTMLTTQLGSLRKVSLECRLESAVQDAADGLPLDAVISAVSPSPDGTLQPVPMTLESPRQVRAAEGRAGFAAVGDSIAALPVVLKTARASRINAHALAASGIASHLGGRWNRWQLADVILHPPGSEEQNQNLPLIEAEAPLWPDRVEAGRYWYAPEYSLRLPDPVMDAASAPFRFGFSVVGHDPQGKPTLEAHVKVTLNSGMAEATRASWESLGQPRCDPVPANGLSANLILPFVDENGTRTETSIASTEIRAVDGGVEIHFSLTDRFARLAYGVLGTAGFQSSAARIDVAYCFPAYVPVEPSKSRVLWGGKSARVDARAVPKPLGLSSIVATHAAANLFTVQPNVVAAHALLLEPAIFVRPKTYGIRTQGRSQAIETFFACSTFGKLYVEQGDPEKAEPDKPIGCLDAWTLGQIKLRLYEPLDIDLGIVDQPYRVLRSMQVPGHFLAVPEAYTITRYEPDDWHGSRPALYLYSNVDAVHPERTSCILLGTLRPAVTPADRQQLIDALAAKVHKSPVLDWPTDLAVEPQFGWALPGGAMQISASAVQTPEGFQASLSASVDYILTLKSLVETSGVTGSVTFKLADGSAIQSTLLIDLSRIDGPWEAGAVSATLRDGKAELSNNTEAGADVTELLLYAGGDRIASMPVEQRLEPHSKLIVDLAVTGADRAFAAYSLVPTGGSLEEIRSFVEDLHTNAVFICGFDLATEQVRKITVEGQIDGVAGAGTVDLVPDRTSGEIAFVLPLTSYLGQPTLKYRTTAAFADGSARTSQWRDWRLDLQGNVIELTTNQIKEG
jgi:hypothetical protein